MTDKTSFKKVVSQHIKNFKAALDARYFVGDAALYLAGTAQELNQQGQWFISRVPLNIGAARRINRSSSLYWSNRTNQFIPGISWNDS